MITGLNYHWRRNHSKTRTESSMPQRIFSHPF